MLPIILQTGSSRIGVVGRGRQALGRLRFVRGAGFADLAIYSDFPNPDLVAEAGDALHRRWPTIQEIADMAVLFVADLSLSESRDFVALARAVRTPVNAEDIKPLCDFHVPALVRRGDLLLTASTGGASPRLARRLREFLEGEFGEDWSGHVAEIAALRLALREAGAGFNDISEATDAWLAERGLLLPETASDDELPDDTSPSENTSESLPQSPADIRSDTASPEGPAPSAGRKTVPAAS
ncbi:MAG: NAD(P)-dependent oxidoreductase [Pseudomonadota bacterium]